MNGSNMNMTGEQSKMVKVCQKILLSAVFPNSSFSFHPIFQ